MHLRVLIVLMTALALLAAACGGSADTSPTTSASTAVAPEVRAFLSLCSVATEVAAENLAGAEAKFEDEVHETLHELADRLESTDRTVSAALLQAKSKVEADFLEDAPDPVRLGADVDGLLGAMADALGAVGLEAPGCPEQPAQLVAMVASVDLYAGAPQRVAVGLVTNENELVSYGSVQFAFSYIGSAEEPVEPEPGPTATATFIPTYGSEGTGDAPSITLPSEARGVYEASDVSFDRAGFWQVAVTADVEDLGPQRMLATLAVAEEPALPAPGDPALQTENLTLDAKGVPPAAVDSRAATEGSIPDPELHGWTIARAVREGRPALVVFATPVYCVSQFCGPVTDMVQDLSTRYGDRAAFIHVEIWNDYETQTLNEAATDWLLLPSGDLTEPWLYLIGADGTILDRWSSLWSEDEVLAALEALPAHG